MATTTTAPAGFHSNGTSTLPPNMLSPTFSVSDREKLMADVEAYCDELRPIEELCYVERKPNPAISELAKKYNILGHPSADQVWRARR